MRSTHQFSITLPVDMANLIKQKVASGEYASESEVIRDGVRALLARDRAVEAWLHQSLAPVYDATVADPARSTSIDTLRQQLKDAHNAELGKVR